MLNFTKFLAFSHLTNFIHFSEYMVQHELWWNHYCGCVESRVAVDAVAGAEFLRMLIFMSSIDLSSFTVVVVESVCFLFTAFRDTNELKFSLHFASNVLLLYIRNPFFLHLPNIFCAFSLEFFTPKKITDKSPKVVLASIFKSRT